MLAAATGFMLRLLGARWRKSWHSNPNGECIEVRNTVRGDDVLVRDTQDRRGGRLKFSAASWQVFVQETRDS